MTFEPAFFFLALAGAVLALIAAASVLTGLATRGRKADEPSPRRSFSWAAGLAFWASLAATMLLFTGFLCAFIASRRLLFRIPASYTDDLNAAAALLSICAAVPAGLAILLAATEAVALRGKKDRYGLGVCGLSALVGLIVLAGALLQKYEVSSHRDSAPKAVEPAPVTPPESR